MARANEIHSGARFGYLTVLDEWAPGMIDVRVRCDCGTERFVRYTNLGTSTNSCGKRGKHAWPSKSHAGARNANWRGGKTSHPLYDIYNDILGRCTRPTHSHYPDYGGRGINVCQRWREDFWAFVADVGERPYSGPGRALWWLDRIDNDGNYEPGNIRWVDPSTSNRNRRNEQMVRHRERNEKGQFV